MNSVLIAPFDRESSLIVADHSGPCGTCGRETFLFVNRKGVTRCRQCDADSQRPKEAMCSARAAAAI